MTRRSSGAVAIAAGMLAVAAAPSRADVAGWNFEPGWFAPGSPNGQAGWLLTGPFDTNVAATAAFGTPTGFGRQSLRASNAVTSGGLGDQAYAPSLTDPAGESSSLAVSGSPGDPQPRYELRMQFRSAVAGAEQPGLAVQVTPVDRTGGRTNSLTIRDTPAGLEISHFDTPSPSCPSGAPGCVAFRDTTVASGLARGTVHSLRLEIEFVEGPDNDVARVFVDDALRFTGESWENYYRNDPEQAGATGNRVPLIDTAAVMTRGVAAPATAGNGLLIDNLRVQTSTPDVPAPPQPSPPETPPQTPPTPSPADPGDRGATPMRILAARMSRRTGVIRARLRCPAAAGMCSAAVTVRGDGHVRFRRDIVRPGGRTVTLRLKPTRANRASLRRAGKVTITVFSRNADGIGSRLRQPLPRR